MNFEHDKTVVKLAAALFLMKNILIKNILKKCHKYSQRSKSHCNSIGSSPFVNGTWFMKSQSDISLFNCILLV